MLKAINRRYSNGVTEWNIPVANIQQERRNFDSLGGVLGVYEKLFFAPTGNVDFDFFSGEIKVKTTYRTVKFHWIQ